ncbi:hypothetical protein [Rhodococcus tibetensis]|uniref:Minor tail protein n=1 Tax=Rhodococcus tibetensis TaxID=2965064 RepID=A0ABT1QH06_9NOCA|nr:hypothetical protein [Rhodococcus sp. FXJ9.536]MCQ4120402.1 hypothetical protein [Rhodococcus sp. FXJ9.536]
MTVNPRPYVMFDGARVACSADQADSQPLSLDGVVIEWGRDDYISHARPATATLSFYDRTGNWPARIKGRAAIGRRLSLHAEDPNDVATNWCCFAGRVTDAQAEPATGTRAGGWIVTVTAAGKDADLGNIMLPPETWPTETMIVRANRIADAAQVVADIDEFYFYPGSVNISCWPLDVKGRSLADLNAEFYMSMGDTFSYNPQQNVVRHLYRRSYSMAIWAVVRGGRIYIQASDIVYDSVTYPGIGILGCEAGAGGPLQLSPQGVVTRVEASWKDRPNGGGDWVSVLSAADDNQNGRRTVTFTSWIDDGVHIDPVLTEVLARGQVEGSLPQHPPAIIDTARDGGFPSIKVAQVLTLGAETQGVVYINGSAFSAWLETVPPVFAIIGGTIEHTGGHWRVTTKLQAVNDTSATTPPIWDSMHTGITWAAPPPAWAFDGSVSWFDTRWPNTLGTIYTPN